MRPTATLSQLASVGSPGQDVKANELNFMLAMVRGIGPKDETDLYLARFAQEYLALHHDPDTAHAPARSPCRAADRN